jgi:hypothetical protein
MGNDSNPKKLTGSATTTIGSSLLYGISINTTLTGTLIVKESTVAIGTFAIGTVAGTYWIVPNGTRFASLSFTLSAADDVTAFTKIQ